MSSPALEHMSAEDLELCSRLFDLLAVRKKPAAGRSRLNEISEA